MGGRQPLLHAVGDRSCGSGCPASGQPGGTRADARARESAVLRAFEAFVEPGRCACRGVCSPRWGSSAAVATRSCRRCGACWNGHARASAPAWRCSTASACCGTGCAPGGRCSMCCWPPRGLGEAARWARPGSELAVVDDDWLAVSPAVAPAGLLAIVPVPACRPLTRGSVLVLDAVQDPGNVGTLLRSAAACGLDQAWLGAGCADPWSWKVLRAGQGSHAVLPVCQEGLDPALDAYRRPGGGAGPARRGAAVRCRPAQATSPCCWAARAGSGGRRPAPRRRPRQHPDAGRRRVAECRGGRRHRPLRTGASVALQRLERAGGDRLQHRLGSRRAPDARGCAVAGAATARSPAVPGRSSRRWPPTARKMGNRSMRRVPADAICSSTVGRSGAISSR
jgi:hypothetical protein